MKAQREHRVPLSQSAVDLLRETYTERGNDHLFIGRTAAGLSSMAMAQALVRIGRADITVHGFRSSFRDWAAERTSYPREICEMALAHTVGRLAPPSSGSYRAGRRFARQTSAAS